MDSVEDATQAGPRRSNDVAQCFCSACDSTLSASAAFCSGCGTRVSFGNGKEPNGSHVPFNSRRHSLVIGNRALVIICTVVAIAVTIVFLSIFNGNTSEDGLQSQNAPVDDDGGRKSSVSGHSEEGPLAAVQGSEEALASEDGVAAMACAELFNALTTEDSRKELEARPEGWKSERFQACRILCTGDSKNAGQGCFILGAVTLSDGNVEEAIPPMGSGCKKGFDDACGSLQLLCSQDVQAACDALPGMEAGRQEPRPVLSGEGRLASAETEGPSGNVPTDTKEREEGALAIGQKSSNGFAGNAGASSASSRLAPKTACEQMMRWHCDDRLGFVREIHDDTPGRAEEDCRNWTKKYETAQHGSPLIVRVSQERECKKQMKALIEIERNWLLMHSP